MILNWDLSKGRSPCPTTSASPQGRAENMRKRLRASHMQFPKSGSAHRRRRQLAQLQPLPILPRQSGEVCRSDGNADRHPFRLTSHWSDRSCTTKWRRVRNCEHELDIRRLQPELYHVVWLL